MVEIEGYRRSFYPMTWSGPKGYPEDSHGGRCYITGLLGALRHYGEEDFDFADGCSGDGFSFRWCPSYGIAAFNGGEGPFHLIWEKMPAFMGYKARWVEDLGWEESWKLLKSYVGRGLPVQVGLNYGLLQPYAAAVSPRHRIAMEKRNWAVSSWGHHAVVAGFDEELGIVVLYEPNEIPENARFEAPIEVFRRAWEEAAQFEGGEYRPWWGHKPYAGEASLHDGYGPYAMVLIDPERDPDWNKVAAIKATFRRNLKILRGEYPKPYQSFLNPYQIPLIYTGVKGMARYAEALRSGELGDVEGEDGRRIGRFTEATIHNHGALGRKAASGYLRTVARELERLALYGAARAVEAASAGMGRSSELFKDLCYEEDLKRAGEILAQIAAIEAKVLSRMEEALPTIERLETPVPAGVP